MNTTRKQRLSNVTIDPATPPIQASAAALALALAQASVYLKCANARQSQVLRIQMDSFVPCIQSRNAIRIFTIISEYERDTALDRHSHLLHMAL